ncbi:ATP-dependent helicase [Nakamurella endophytica]|uniref:ATP-dependent helicase n=1 Tax=Nakamurella endophytica TaxID=1748367 RepID=UPI0016687326|nr:ATP-dependent DNA helicase [Nakamurella endophytica]
MRYRLLLPSSPGPVHPTDEQRRVVDHDAGRLKVLAGPGTGKTTTIVESVAARIERGTAPEEILVLTFSRRAAAELAQRIARRVGVTTREPLVRTLHSYAYHLLRDQATVEGQPVPRLLGAGETDRMVRELLAGHCASGGGPWPVELHAAITSQAFAAELRDLMLRAAERGIGPTRMIELGRRHNRPEWVAAGRFTREYQQVGDLRQISAGLGVALDQAELTVAALAELSRDEVLRREQSRIRRVFVDEYQDVDPAQARLVEMIGSGARELVVVGDPDQAVYAFRGADPGALRDFRADDTVALTEARRLPAELVTATRRVAERLPGPAVHRVLRSAGTVDTTHAATAGRGPLAVVVLPGVAQQAAFVADELRRAHLIDGVAWRKMAVLVRSPAAEIAALSRAFGVAGVPLVVGRPDQVLETDPVVSALLTVIRCGLDLTRLTGDAAAALLSSPLGGLDALALRRLRRALRAGSPGTGSAGDLLAGILVGGRPSVDLPPDLRPAVVRLSAMVGTVQDRRSDATAEDLLWRLWRRAGLEAGLVAASERGGRAGQQADRTLDAVLALFSLAAEVAERLPLAGVESFLATAEQQLIADGRESTRDRQVDAVTVLSAHASKGLEWQVVVVAGVQEGRWPDLGRRDSLLHTAELLDRAAGQPVGTGFGRPLVDERRLFYVAATRAGRRLVCTAVSDADHEPSRFLEELLGTAPPDASAGPGGTGSDPGDGRRSRHLELTALVADLRRTVTDPSAEGDLRRRAAEHLAELALAGVRGADPADWYGLAEVSSTADVVPTGAVVQLSPSAVETLLTCPLRAVLERRGGSAPMGDAQVEGIAAHALAHGLALGLSDEQIEEYVDGYAREQTELAPWQRRRIAEVLTAMSRAARSWYGSTHPPRTLLGSEVDLDVRLPADPDDPDSTGRPVRLKGRVDWLSADPDGALVVTDFKTAATPATRAKVRDHPQLATYQVAVAAGAFEAPADGSGGPDGPVPVGRSAEAAAATTGGAELVYLRGGVPKTLAQPPLDAQERALWTGRLREAAEQLASANLLARENDRCDRCPVRGSCPVQADGEQVTR